VESEILLSAMRKLAQKFDALDYEFSAIYERARLLQDEIAGRATAITNRRLFTLSVLTACMLPSTLVTGFFGMNTKDMPFRPATAVRGTRFCWWSPPARLPGGCSGGPRRSRARATPPPPSPPTTLLVASFTLAKSLPVNRSRKLHHLS
jgi:hypothetical protein